MKIKIGIKQKLNIAEAERISQICEENRAENGGTLHYYALGLPSKYIALVKHMKNVIGYAILYPDVLVDNDIYVMQVAIDKKYHHLGIGTKLYQYCYNHSKGYSCMTANAHKTNFVSQNFHKKFGMEDIGFTGDSYVYCREIEKNISKNFENAKPETFEVDEKMIEEAIE